MKEERKAVVGENMGESVEKLSQIEVLNKLRKNYRNTDVIWKICSVLSVVLAVLIIYMGYIGQFFGNGILRLILCVIAVLLIPFCLYILPFFLKMSSKFKAYNTEYKVNFLQHIIQKEFPKANYKSEDKISIREISECSMIKKARSANANDCIEGVYKGVDFLRCDMELTYKNSKKSSDCVLIACNNRTELKSEIQIIQRSFTIGKESYEKPEEYAEYSTGNESFDKKFCVYVQDSDEASEFIDKKLMKKLTKFSGGGPISAFFDKKKAYLVIRRKKDAMEAPIYKSIKESSSTRGGEKEARIIREWIEILDSCVVR